MTEKLFMLLLFTVYERWQIYQLLEMNLQPAF